MEFSWRIYVFAIVLKLSAAIDANTQKRTNESIVAVSEKLSKPESEPKLFYQAVNKTLRDSAEFKLYSKRVDCIIKSMTSENAIESVDKNLYKTIFNITEFKVIFVNETAVMMKLQPKLDKANFNCTIIGYIAIICISTILLFVVTCVACISKK